MQVKDLIKLLQTCPQDRLVVMASDAEGNGFSELGDNGVELEAFYNESERDVVHPDDIQDIPVIKVVCLWP